MCSAGHKRCSTTLTCWRVFAESALIWEPRTLRERCFGFDGERITGPIRDEQDRLQGLLRLRLDGSQRPKVLAAPATRLGLIPYPRPDQRRLLLVEGPADMLAARGVGLSAVAVPGTQAWRADWGSPGINVVSVTRFRARVARAGGEG